MRPREYCGTIAPVLGFLCGPALSPYILGYACYCCMTPSPTLWQIVSTPIGTTIPTSFKSKIFLHFFISIIRYK